MRRIPRPHAIARVVALAVTLLAADALVILGQPQAIAASAVTINGSTTFQRIDGFGFSEAFGRANIMHGSNGLSAVNQRRALDLLFSTSIGAGFSILRNIIASSPNETIALTSPANPATDPAWRWDGSDSSRVFTLPSGQTITSGWNATYATASGQITASNVNYNATIAAGGSTSIGFQAFHTGNTATPASFALNGVACAVG